jgi:BirA family biotin operon repressor/biotin-[acetyl-CoA-carboxylase] ligase
MIDGAFDIDMDLIMSRCTAQYAIRASARQVPLISKFETLNSTNTYLKTFNKNLSDRSIVLAYKQTAGRGRQSRSFASPEGGLYMSILFKNFSDELITVRAGVVVADVLSALGVDAKIKWVNDIYIGDKKVCGILTETITEATTGNNTVIVGIGLNIKDCDALPEIATSLEAAYGIRPDIDTLAENIAGKLFESLHDKNIIKRYKAYSCVLGKSIMFGTFRGVATGINEKGNLTVKLPNGSIVNLNAGEISIKIL